MNNGGKDRFWIGFRGLILVNRSFIILILASENKATQIKSPPNGAKYGYIFLGIKYRLPISTQRGKE